MKRTIIYTKWIVVSIQFTCPLRKNYDPLRMNYGTLRKNYGPLCINYGPLLINYGSLHINQATKIIKKNYEKNYNKHEVIY